MESAGELRRALIGSVAILVFLVVLLSVIDNALLSRYYFTHQDRIAGIGSAFALALCLLVKGGAAPQLKPPTPWGALAIGLAIVLGTWFGAHALFLDYAVSRDELMARFDAQIFARGRLAWPVAPEWQGYVLALVPDFLLPVPEKTVVVSGYMPGHAMLRSMFGQMFDPALLNPLLTGAGFVAMFDVARRLLAQSPMAQWVVLAGYALSAQVLANAMTSYAMSAHLATNCIWLALFLRDKWYTHATAMMVGVLAIGLHQIVFHPLFAGPILLTLLAKRRWRLFCAYALVYAVALLGWLSYHGWALGPAGLTESGAGGGAMQFLIERVLPLVTRIDPYTIPLMLYNMLRFVAWMPVFVLPLLLLSGLSIRKREGLALPLFAGLALSLFMMAWLLPYQGHGWGYRYLHGLIVNVLLLAGYGVVVAERENAAVTGRVVLVLGIATLPVLAFLAATSQAFIAPYAALSDRLARQPADFVILDTNYPGSAIDQVRNDPDFSNRPMVLSSEFLDRGMVVELCRRGTVTLVEKSDFSLPQFGMARDENPYRAAYGKWLKQQSCYRRSVD